MREAHPPLDPDVLHTLVPEPPASLAVPARAFTALTTATAPGDAVEALAALTAWMRGVHGGLPLPADADLGPAATNARLRRTAFILLALERRPVLRARVGAAIATLLADGDAAAALAATGGHDGRGFLGELLHRAVRRVLPTPHDDHDLGAIIARLFPDAAALASLRAMPPSWAERFARALAPEHGWHGLREEAATALRLLATRVAARGLEPRLWRLAPTAALAHSPFLRLVEATSQRLDGGSAPAAFAGTLDACLREADAIAARLEQTGITVAVVHDLAAIRRGIERMQVVAATLEGDAPAAAHGALLAVAEAQQDDRGIRALLRTDLQSLARRIVERHGDTGEHYIARDRRGYAAMWRAALGGGLLTVVTAALKLRITGLGLAPLPEGLLVSLDYAASFLIMLSLHLALATKQPAMTGATLAAILRSAGGPQRTDILADHVADTVRTQLAAALGNVSAVLAGAFAVDAALRALTGAAWVGSGKAAHILHDLHPLGSGTLPFATLTGVILWLSGLVGGWFENWSTAHRLPDAIAQHPWGARGGRTHLQRAGAALQANAAAWGGSVALGLLLGLAPALGRFVGVPLDVRHVTLSTGTLGFAVSALGPSGLAWTEVAWAVAGIACIFVLNLGVSFLLALALALRAHGVPWSETLRLARKLIGRFTRRPWSLIGPPPA